MFDIYKNKKVLITGHTGFKGSWLTIWLLMLGADVIGYALNPKTKKDNYVLCKLSNYIKDYRADIRNKKKIFDVINKNQPDIIFHLAAQPLVLESYKNPIETIEINTLGTSYVLEAFRNSEKTKVLIIITTDKVYKNRKWFWGYREEDPLGGNDIYSASKAACEIFIEAYRESFFKDSDKLIASARAGNVIGGGDWSDNRIVPDCIKALESKKVIYIRNPESIRPWQHVLEPISGYLLLGEKLLKKQKMYADAWNFGPGNTNVFKVIDLVHALIKSYGHGTYKFIDKNKFSKEAKYLSLDISKTINKLKWKPILNFDEMIKFTVDWYKEYRTVNTYDFCIDQIKQYIKLWKLRNLI